MANIIGWVTAVGIAGIVLLIVCSVIAAVLMFSWNISLGMLFDLPTLEFSQALGLVILISLVGKLFTPSTHSK